MDGHDLCYGQLIVDGYGEVGLASKIRLPDGLTNKNTNVSRFCCISYMRDGAFGGIPRLNEYDSSGLR